jgi:predicted nucleic-acid-binding Zn-ribbon protein
MPKKPESRERIVTGNRLQCPICRHKRFWERKTLMNTSGMTFLGFEWANRKATNYVCENCGYVYWFLE